jgi:hypothetical protein
VETALRDRALQRLGYPVLWFESHFKTMTYQPDYPGRFASVLHARAWLQVLFGWHKGSYAAESQSKE